MKKIRFAIVLSLFLISLGFSACKKEDVKLTGNAIFYTTSASAGGSFIDVEVNGSYQGRISKYVPSKPTNCEAIEGGVIKVTGLEIDKAHTYKATGQDGKKWEGTFTVISDTNQCWAVGFLN